MCLFQAVVRVTRLDYNSYWMSAIHPYQHILDETLTDFLSEYFNHPRGTHAVDQLNYNGGVGGGYQAFADAAAEILYGALIENADIDLYNAHELLTVIRGLKQSSNIRVEHQEGSNKIFRARLQKALNKIRARTVGVVFRCLLK